MSEIDMVPVFIEWHDAHASSDGWEERGDLEDNGPAVVYTCGYLLTAGQGGKENHISVVQTWSQDDMVHSVFHIPVQMVQRVDTLVRSHELANVAVFPKTSSASG